MNHEYPDWAQWPSANLEQNSGLLIILIILYEVNRLYDPVKKERKKKPLHYLVKLLKVMVLFLPPRNHLKDKASAGVDIL